MLAITRERLSQRLDQLKAVTDLYGVRDPAFPAAALQWLEGTETSLGEIRNPLASLASAERGRVLAAADGLRDPEIRAEKTSARQAERAGAAAALARVERALREALVASDASLATAKDQMAQLVAYASTKNPIPAPGGEPREQWLARVWQGLAVNGDGKTLQTHAYLAARLPWVDRLYVLGDVLDNVFSNGS